MLQNYLKQVTITNINPSEHKICSELLSYSLSKARRLLITNAHQEEKADLALSQCCDIVGAKVCSVELRNQSKCHFQFLLSSGQLEWLAHWQTSHSWVLQQNYEKQRQFPPEKTELSIRKISKGRSRTTERAREENHLIQSG